MMIDITGDTISRVKNSAFAQYATRYLDIYDDFLQQVTATGIEVAAEDEAQANAAKVESLMAKGATLRNVDRSIFLNRISPACVACQKGIGSATFFISLQCHRDCYYCFNPNQVDYDRYTANQRDLVRELEHVRGNGYKMNYLALTGGEPLLHKQETVDFFDYANRHFPGTHTRLYTTGDHANQATLESLQASGLQEIRFSIRMHDLARGHRHTLDRIAAARDYIPTVMVEMPILPDSLEEMKDILLQLEQLDIHSINLLEFCYPLTNAGEFRKRGYKIRKRPYKILYNYWYAGGVPIAGSESVCLDLVNFALDEELTIGVHYCSLENKLTGQNYQQNYGQRLPETHTFSQKDYLLKSAKVFGSDIPRVFNAFRGNGYDNFNKNKQPRYLEFHIGQIESLRELDPELEIGLSTSTFETRGQDLVLRELKVDLTTPNTFNLERDI